MSRDVEIHTGGVKTSPWKHPVYGTDYSYLDEEVSGPPARLQAASPDSYGNLTWSLDPKPICSGHEVQAWVSEGGHLQQDEKLKNTLTGRLGWPEHET